jgi:type IV secretion system protein VirB6
METTIFSTNVFDYMGQSVQNVAEAYALDTAKILVDELIPVTLMATTIYFIVFGYMIALGHSQYSMSEFIKRSLVITIILTIALFWGSYVDNIYNVIIGGADGGIEQQILSILPQGTLTTGNGEVVITMPADTPGEGNAKTIYERLDESFSLGATKAYQAQSLAAKNKDQNTLGIFFMEYGCGLILGLATVVAVFCSGALIIMSKLAIAILIAVGPLFIFFLLYPTTRRFFDKWLGQLFTYIFAYVLLVVVTVFALEIFNYYLGKIIIDETTINNNSINFTALPLQLLIISMIILYVIKQVPQIAASLCSGAGLSSPMSAYYAMSSPASTLSGKGGTTMTAGRTIPGAGGLQNLSAGTQNAGAASGNLTASEAFRGPRDRGLFGLNE